LNMLYLPLPSKKEIMKRKLLVLIITIATLFNVTNSIAQCDINFCTNPPTLTADAPIFDAANSSIVINNVTFGEVGCAEAAYTVGIGIYIYQLLPDGTRMFQCTVLNSPPDNVIGNISVGFGQIDICGQTPFNLGTIEASPANGFEACDGAIYEVELVLYTTEDLSFNATDFTVFSQLPASQYLSQSLGTVESDITGEFPGNGQPLTSALLTDLSGDFGPIELTCGDDINLYVEGLSRLANCLPYDDISTGIPSELTNELFYSVNSAAPVIIQDASTGASGGQLTGPNADGICYAGILGELNLPFDQVVGACDGAEVVFTLRTTDLFTSQTEEATITVNYSGGTCDPCEVGCPTGITAIDNFQVCNGESFDLSASIAGDPSGAVVTWTDAAGVAVDPAGILIDLAGCQSEQLEYIATLTCTEDANITFTDNVLVSIFPSDITSFVTPVEGGCTASLEVSADCQDIISTDSFTANPGESGIATLNVILTDDICAASFTIDVAYACSANPVLGCTNPDACNYNPDATEDDGSCADNDCLGVCDGPAIIGSACDDNDDTTENDVYSADCVCAGTVIPILGCTNEYACNYNPDATQDDGSCFEDIVISVTTTCDPDVDGQVNVEFIIAGGLPSQDATESYSITGDFTGTALAGQLVTFQIPDNSAFTLVAEDSAGCDGSTGEMISLGCNLPCDITAASLSLPNGSDMMTICVDDDIDEPIDIQSDGGMSDNGAWVITDQSGAILALPTYNPPFLLDGAGVGTCLISYINWSGDLLGLDLGGNVNTIDGECFIISNEITVNRQECAIDIEGCTDAAACNFNPDATIDNGTCAVNDCNGDCGGSATAGAACDDGNASTSNDTFDADCNCVGELIDVFGCTDASACNFNPDATEDDGSCTIDDCIGECGGSAIPGAACDDGDANTSNDTYNADCNCVGETAGVSGCTDASACNFNPDATEDDGSCAVNDCNGECGGSAIPGTACDDGDDTTDGDIWSADCECVGEATPGCTDVAACNFNPNATIDDGSCALNDCNGECGGASLPGTTCDDGDANTTNDTFDADCNCVGETAGVLGCTDASACNFNPDATEDDGSCAVNDCNGECGGTATAGTTCDDGDASTTNDTYNANCECIGESTEIGGCTDPDAVNYNPNATIDDGSCVLYCTSQAGTLMITNGGGYNNAYLCLGESVIVDADDFLLVPGQSVFYIFHNEANPTASNLPSNIYTTGSFYTNTGPAGTIYVTAFGANDDGTGLPNFNDPCLTISNTIPLTLLNPIEIEVTEDCDGTVGELELTIGVSGGLPQALPGSLFDVSGTFFTGTALSGDVLLVGPITDEGPYTIQVEDSNGCIGIFDDYNDCIKVLPIELIQLSATAETDGNLVKWSTASEIENDYFSIYHSVDGTNFSIVTTVEGSGTSSIANSYQYLHREAPSGISYYKLVQTDFDGTSYEEGVVSVLRGEQANQIMDLYPMPVVDHLNIVYQSTNQTEMQYYIYNTLGELMIANTQPVINGINDFNIELNNFASGVYIIHIENGDRINTQKFIVE